MSIPLTLAFLWMIAANVAGMLPSNDNHWRRAYVLIAVGLPILGWVFLEHSWWVGLLVLAAGMSVLRWPVRYLMRWINRMLGQGE